MEILRSMMVEFWSNVYRDQTSWDVEEESSHSRTGLARECVRKNTKGVELEPYEPNAR